MKSLDFFMYAVVFLPLAIGIAYVALKQLIRFFEKNSLLDMPDERKTHTRPTPSSGGLVFGLLALLTIPFLVMMEASTIPVWIGLGLMAVGFFDDRYDWSAKIKFGFQFLASGIIIWQVGAITLIEHNPFYINELVTLCFLVGFINAFNLIDGIDGLAGTYALYTLVVLVGLLLMHGVFVWAIYGIVLIGGIIGFLKLNWNPARIFMGDAGSLFLGFSIAALSLIVLKNASFMLSVDEYASELTLIGGVLSLPVFDTLRVMTMRIRKKKSPFKPDRTHLHHLLGKMGLATSGIVCAFLMLAIGMVMLSVLIIWLKINVLTGFLFLMVAGMFIFYLLTAIRVMQHNRRIGSYRQNISEAVAKNQLIAKYHLKNTKTRKL